MSTRSFTAALATTAFLAVLLIAPLAFLAAPQPVYAEGADAGVPTGEVPSSLLTFENIISAIKNTISAISDQANEASLKLLVVDKYVIKPLAFILSGNVLKAMTSSVVSFVIGKTNGTGVPQFAQNVNGLMQNIGDKQASVFLAQLGRSPNSPFAAAVASSLRTNYLQQTSAAGFFAATQCTLTQSSPNINAFLNGDWSQGGVRAWFALTTQTQNNPYTFYQASQNQLSTLVGTAQAAQSKQLDWGQGFLSWCGPAGGTESFDEFGLSLGVSGPAPNCTQADGSPGSILTPGSVIAATLNKTLGADQDKLVAAGEAGNEINGILGNIGAALNSVNSAVKLIGGVGNSFGLAGAAYSSGTNRSVLGDLATPGYAGVTPVNVYQTAATLPSSGLDLSNRVATYQTAWNAITAAANNASSTAATFVKFCSAQGNVAEGVAAQIQSVLTQSAAAAVTAATATAAVQRLQNDLNTGVDASLISVELQTLQNMPPTNSDVAVAESNAQSSGAVNASTAGSLTASNLSLVDQMNLIILNVQKLESACVERRVAQYQAAWNAITAAADTAQASITALLNSCPAQASAVAGFTTQIQSVRTQAAAAAQIAARATSVDMPPFEADVAAAQAQARPSGVTSSPSLVDQMNTITASVQALQLSCPVPAQGTNDNFFFF